MGKLTQPDRVFSFCSHGRRALLGNTDSNFNCGQCEELFFNMNIFCDSTAVCMAGSMPRSTVVEQRMRAVLGDK